MDAPTASPNMAISSSVGNQKVQILDLPLETQKQIVGYVDRKDLFSLQTVSQHFHGLASAEIYRELDFNIISYESEDSGNPASRAADALQTILASEHDYGQHIKAFRLGAVASGSFSFGNRYHNAYDDQLIMTRLLWDSKTDPSKFLNTAVLLMARKAKVLEKFIWDAPIELSSAVYQTLQKTPSLRHLLVRLDIQPSPKIGIRHHHAPGHHHVPPPPGLPPPASVFPPALAASSTSQPFILGPDIGVSKRRRTGHSRFWTKRQAFSGFRYLSKLELMGISGHECLAEVAQCIKASSATLKSFTLTLSVEMARKSRKPVTAAPAPAIHDDLSDTELDDDEVLSHPLPPPPSMPQPANEADIREEKLAQENILATIFDLQSVAQVGKKLEKKLSLSGGKCFEEDETKALREHLDTFLKYLQDSQGPENINSTYRREQLKTTKGFIDALLKNHASRPKKTTTSNGKDAENGLDKDLVLIKKKAKPSANSSSYKLSSSFSNQFDSLMNSLPPGYLDDDGHPLFPTGPSGSASTKSSSYSFPNNYFGGTGSSSEFLPPPPLPNPSNGPYASHTIQLPYSYSHSHSHASSGSHTPTLSSSMYPYSTNGYSAPLYSPPVGMQYPNKSTISISKHHKPPKPKKYSPKKVEPPKKPFIPSSDDSETDIPQKAQKSTVSKASLTMEESHVETMNVDLEHPDEDLSDLGEDQEAVPGTEDLEVPTPRKRFKTRDSEPGSPVKEKGGESSSTIPLGDKSSEITVLSASEAMRDYVRATHGLQLDEIRLHYIPLKASIVARALDLTVLQRVTLLEVGSQDTFWALLVRLTNTDSRIAFKSIHTDNVSVAFTKYLASYAGLEELFMHERHAKHDPDAELTVDISRLRKVALNGHMPTLKRLMIRNERDDTWDVDSKTLQFFALKGQSLVELACGMRMQTYHILIQMFAAFAKLDALHLILLRHADRNLMLQLESLNFAIDGLSHCSGVKLRYLALAEQVTFLNPQPTNFRKHLEAVMEQPKVDRKGKGKAVDGMVNGDIEDDASDHDADEVFVDLSKGERLSRRSVRFDEVDGVKIFTREVRLGKL